MRTLSHAHGTGESHGIDLAPMLDFVVNLLIFFIITAVFVRARAASRSRRPSADSRPTADSSSKSVAIDERGEVAIDGRPIDLPRRARTRRAVSKAVGLRRAAASSSSPTSTRPRERSSPSSDQIRLGGVSDITFTTGSWRGPVGNAIHSLEHDQRAVHETSSPRSISLPQSC